MKKLYFLIILTVLFTGCEMYDDYKQDYESSAVYYAIQKPLRTIQAGKGLNLQVGVVLGGRRENDQKEIVQFEIQDSLLDGTGFTLLPSDYYTLSNESQMVIPAGSFQGRIDITLDSTKFLNDPHAYKNYYALPFKITEATTNVLRKEVDPQSGVVTQQAMDYTIPVIKFINAYHGTYYHKGRDITYNSNDEPIDTTVYSVSDLVKNETWDLSTVGPKSLVTNGIGSHISQSNNKYSMKLTIQDDGNLKIDSVASSKIIELSEKGGSVYKAEDKKIILNYGYSDESGLSHDVTDTLFFRDNGMKYEEW